MSNDSNEELVKTIVKLGKQLEEMTESRDRVLRENCEMTQKLRDLAAIARVAKKLDDGHDVARLYILGFLQTIQTSIQPSRESGELKRLLEQHQALYQR